MVDFAGPVTIIETSRGSRQTFQGYELTFVYVLVNTVCVGAVKDTVLCVCSIRVFMLVPYMEYYFNCCYYRVLMQWWMCMGHRHQ